MMKFLGDPYRNVDTIEYKLSIPPSTVMEVMKEKTENLTPLQISSNRNAQFWSRLSGNDDFRILRKPNEKGYRNSYAPWLIGCVSSDEEGCSVKIHFEMFEKFSRLDKFGTYFLIIMMVILSLIYIFQLLSPAWRIRDALFGAMFIVFMWLGTYGRKKVDFLLGKKDIMAMLEFIENLFADYKIS